MTQLVTYSSGTVSLPGHLWDRIIDALGINSVAWEDEERSVRDEHAELIEELESLGHYLAAHGGGKTDTLPEIEGELLDNKRQDDATALPFDTDSEGMNDRRAGWAEAALNTFQAETGTDDCDAIGDLVADLAHLCDREGERFGRSVRDKIERGLRAYEAETTDEAPEEAEAATVVGVFA